jgi:hypothetical protein
MSNHQGSKPTPPSEESLNWLSYNVREIKGEFIKIRELLETIVSNRAKARDESIPF